MFEKFLRFMHLVAYILLVWSIAFMAYDFWYGLISIPIPAMGMFIFRNRKVAFAR